MLISRFVKILIKHVFYSFFKGPKKFLKPLSNFACVLRAFCEKPLEEVYSHKMLLVWLTFLRVVSMNARHEKKL